jgi:thiamine kinase-like enzyme
MNTDTIKTSLSRLLHMNIQEITPLFESAGYSGNAQKIMTVDERKQKRTLLLKRVFDASDYQFYQEVLRPYDLNAPEMFGIISIADTSFLVSDYIPHQPAEWQNFYKFRRAVEWLVKKDTIAAHNLEKLKACASVQKTVRNHIQEWLACISKGVEMQVHPLLTGKFLSHLLYHEIHFQQARSLLLQKQQTINHNDFQMYNILFGIDEREEISIIDWSGPNIGSVCVDLAKLLIVAPARFGPAITEHYRSHISFEGFHEILEAALLLTKLTIFAWMLEMLIKGRPEAISFPQFQTIYKELQEI